MNAVNELEPVAVKYASEAIRLDNQGSKGMAITYYQKAIDVLLKIVNLYPRVLQKQDTFRYDLIDQLAF